MFLSVKDGRSEPQSGKGRKLTPKMLSFIDAYFGEAMLNATEAVRLSAYKSKNPALLSVELLDHPLVAAEVARRQLIRQQKSEVKAEYLIAKLIDMIEKEQTRNPQAALRAIELAGKSIALWKERQEISGPDGNAIKHEQHVKESAESFTSRVLSLAKRNGTSNVIEFPNAGDDGGT